MYTLFLAFVVCYNGAKVIEIDQDLTELQLNIGCPFECTAARVQFLLPSGVRVCTHVR